MCAGCAGRLPPPPHRLAFLLAGHTPRTLSAYEETVVPLTITNTGQDAWDPKTVHVSYHWLWFVPRELASRSRSQPYHDGIRTELEGMVAPGAVVAVQGRLLAPTVPGLYWLQWDLVEEGVTWFAQISPRQPRQLVVVLPTPADLFAPLPTVIALGGLAVLAIARSRSSTPAPSSLAAAAMVADLLWGAASLLSKPLILVREALLEPTAVAYWLLVVAAVVPPLLALALFPRRVRAIAVLASGLLGTLIILGDVIYYRFFGDVLSASALLGIRQTGQVWGSIRSLISPALFWLVVDVPFGMALTVVLASRRPVDSASARRHRLVATGILAPIAVAAVVSAAYVLRGGRLEQVFRDRAAMEQLGPFGYHAYDVWSFAKATLLRAEPTPEQIDSARRWFADRARLRAGSGAYFGAAAGKNLIVVQVESLQDFVVDFRVGGEEVMPTLRQWSNDGLRFTDVTDQTHQGRTSDAELTALASLLPLDQGAAAFRFSSNHYVGLPRVLSEHGYSTLSAVPFESGFWNRRVMHPAYGFQQSLFEPDFELTEQIGWGLNDRDFFKQMAPRLSRLPRPFAAWLITLSLHHPFDDFPDKYKQLRLGSLERTSFGNYLHTMRFFDQALAEFKASLARDGLLDDSLVVVFGDHDAGFPREASIAAAIGVGSDDASWALNDRVPLFLRLPATARGRTGVVSVPAGQTDFAPTLLALLGIDPARLPYVGRNLLGEPDDPPVLRPHGDWLDGAHLFLAGGSATPSRACFSSGRAVVVQAAACQPAGVAASSARDVARLVLSGDLQQRLRELLR